MRMLPPEPTSIVVRANGLEHHVLRWQALTEPRGIVALVHGFMDAAGTWDRVGPALAESGFVVLAPDMRGFGRGPRAPAGSYYHFVDYVADLCALLPKEPISLVGHSMGGTIVTYFAGAFPERVQKLVVLEGLGPPDNPVNVGPDRMRRWVDEVERTKERRERTMTHDEALDRLCGNHPNVPRDVLASRIPHLVEDVEGGRVKWRFDPLHRTTSPVPFFADLYREFAKRITCPVMFVSGGPNGFHPPDEEARLAAFSNLRRVELATAGHMMHWTEPTALTASLLGFLA